MKRSSKAALLSAFVFPGAGHLYLKRYLSGAFLSAGAASALYILVSDVVRRAYEIVTKIQTGEAPPDLEAIIGLVSEQSHVTESSALSIAGLVLIGLWLIGVVDSYWRGGTEEKADQLAKRKKE